MEDFETNVVSEAESFGLAESHDDNVFDKGFLEEFGSEGEEPEGTEEPKESEPETEEEAEAAESGEKEPEKVPEMISFKEAGKDFSAPKEAVEAFAKAVGRDVTSLIDVYQKGCNYDKLNDKLSEALKYSEAFDKLAVFQNKEKEALREEILATLEQTKINAAVAKIKQENPGINDAAAKELANFRLAEQKPKAEAPKEEKNSEEISARLREVEIFEAKHPELPSLPNEVIELWEKSGISLESAFEGFQNKNKVAELEKKIAEMELKQKKDEQKALARETSPGSASSAAGVTGKDPFLEAFGGDY